MCIIAHKPAGVRFPTKDTLKACFNNNPDGAGFMYPATDGTAVEIRKGFTSFTAFWRALKAARAETGDSTPYVLHFRISTQAGCRRDCTHPFPLSRNMDDLRELTTAARFGVAHNGIISLTTHNARGITHNDTMEFITDYLSLIIRASDYWQDPDTLELIDRLAGSRLAIMDASGYVQRTGKGWQNVGGVWYSNGSFRDYGRAAWTLWDLEPDTEPEPLPVDYDPTDCPLVRYGDDTHCSMCYNFGHCYGMD